MKIDSRVSQFSARFTPRQTPVRQTQTPQADTFTLRFGSSQIDPEERLKRLVRDTDLFVQANQQVNHGVDAFENETYDRAAEILETARETVNQMSFDHPEHVKYPRCYLTDSHERQKLERMKLQLKVQVNRFLGDTYQEMGRHDEAITLYREALPAAHALARENNQRIWEAKNLYPRIAQSQINQEDHPAALATMFEATRELARYRDPIAHGEEIADKEDHLYNFEAEERFLHVMAQIYLHGMQGDTAKAEALKTNTRAMNLRQQYDGKDTGLYHLLDQRKDILAAQEDYEAAAQVQKQMEKIILKAAEDLGLEKQDPTDEEGEDWKNP